MSKKLRRILTITIIFIVAALIGFLYYRNQKTYYNTYSINGNTPGNLYNNGLFCEHNGFVYFANPDDNNRLYSMSSDESNITKITDDTAYYINADDHYVYYARNKNSDESSMSFLNVSRNSLCRVNQNGKNLKILDDDPCNYVSLLGNKLYYLHYDKDEATTLYSISIDGKERSQVDEEPINTSCSIESTIYYTGTKTDHNVHILNTQNNAKSQIYEANAWMPDYQNNYLYYLDCENNYRLTRTTLDNAQPEVLTDEGIEQYNIYGNYIFYQTLSSNNPALYVYNISSNQRTLIAEGEYTNLCVTSSYLYFSEYGKENEMLHTPYTGSIQVSNFQPGAKK